MKFETQEDADLVEYAKNGDLDAYDEIVNRYQERVWAYLFKFCPHQSELEDLVQETFIKVYKNLSRWRPSGTFKSWLMRVALNTGYDYYRKKRNEPLYMAQKWEGEIDFDPLEQLKQTVEKDSCHPNAELIERILIKLNPADRLIVTLQYYERLTLPEIAEQMNWSLAKTKIKSFRARKQLKEILNYYGIDGPG